MEGAKFLNRCPPPGLAMTPVFFFWRGLEQSGPFET